ncbi:MAG TPA: RagB/SusD family nutrient uptake outer membrane protein [Pseudobacter sp.]|nr:RagB/SusD family nutrient uptake outer membrane protein [Pseudobacter sp.]
MKKYFCSVLLLLLLFSASSCKKFLLVEPIERLSGNIYWKSQADVEAFVNDLYARFWLKISGAAYTSAAGELRAGEIRPSIGGSYNSNDANRRRAYDFFGVNDLRTAIDPTRAWNTSTGANQMNIVSMTRWTEFYQVIQGANLMYYQVDKGVPGVSNEQAAAYKAEAIYIRCLTYFFMVRLFGDVAYYTNAFQAEPLGREGFVGVLNKCIAELQAGKNDLPLRYDDAVFRGVRATRGAAAALLMNMNMWNAAFDEGNKSKYYEQTAALGEEIISSNVYQLVNINDISRVMLGKSEEGIIEFKESVDAGGTYNKFAFAAEMLVAFPEKAQAEGTYSHAYYRSTYLEKIFADQTDKRRSLWFTNMLRNDGIFSLKKFAGPVSPKNFPDWAIILCRYADVILMRAEALAELEQDEQAINMLNMVRRRAQAQDYDITENLKDAIFTERSKELIGEGIHYYDLVRTKRILDGAWTSAPLTAAQFNSGGWTWPISESALNRNPFMTLNTYWQ